MIAQEYIYDQADASVVIAGSSLSQRLRSDKLPAGVFNLSLSGESALDGVRIVHFADTRPRVVFIETNVLSKTFDADFEDRLLRPGISTLRYAMISLRDEARALTVARYMAHAGFGRLFERKGPDPSLLQDGEPSLQQAGTTKLFDQLLSIQKLDFQNPLTDEQQAQLVAELSIDVDALVKRGTEVVFFEMPINPSLFELPLLNSIRRIIKQKFPNQRYVRISDCATFKTQDGVHLDGKEAENATMEFAKIIDQKVTPQSQN